MLPFQSVRRTFRKVARAIPSLLILAGTSLGASGVVLLGGASPAVAGPAGPFAYVTNFLDGSVSVIDIPTDTVVDTIPGFSYPVRDTVSPDASLLYVSEQGAGDVAVVDTATDAIVAHVPTGSGPYDIAFTPDGATAYVVADDGTITPINTATNVAGTPIVVAGGSLQGAAVSPDGTRLYVADTNANHFLTIDTATHGVLASVSIPAGTGGIVLSPDGSTAYLSSSNSTSGFTEINTATDVVSQLPVGSTPEGIAIEPNGAKVFAADQFLAGVDVLDTLSNTASTSTAGSWSQPDAVAVTADSTNVFVTNFSGDYVSVLDASTDLTLATIGVGLGPCAVAIAPPPAAQLTITLPTFSTGQDPRGVTVPTSGDDLEPGSSVHVYVTSGPAPIGTPVDGTLVGTFTTDSSGAFSNSGDHPEHSEPGRLLPHRLGHRYRRAVEGHIYGGLHRPLNHDHGSDPDREAGSRRHRSQHR